MGVCACHRPRDEVREQLTGAGFLLPTMWVLGLGSGHQAGQQVPLPFELACSLPFPGHWVSFFPLSLSLAQNLEHGQYEFETTVSKQPWSLGKF